MLDSLCRNTDAFQCSGVTPLWQAVGTQVLLKFVSNLQGLMSEDDF